MTQRWHYKLHFHILIYLFHCNISLYLFTLLQTINQKRQRVRDSKNCLDLFNRNPSDFSLFNDHRWVMNPPLHTRIERISKTVGRTQWNCTKANKDTTIDWKGYGFCFLGFQWYIVHWLFGKRKKTNSDYYCALLDWSKEVITKKRPHLLKKKCIFLQDNAPAHKSIKRWQKSMNYTSNCFPTHVILQISTPATFIFSQTWKDGFRDSYFYQMKRSSGKPMAIWEAMTNPSLVERDPNVGRSLG